MSVVHDSGGFTDDLTKSTSTLNHDYAMAARDNIVAGGGGICQ